jgi:hypothetical protein
VSERERVPNWRERGFGVVGAAGLSVGAGYGYLDCELGF